MGIQGCLMETKEAGPQKWPGSQCSDLSLSHLLASLQTWALFFPFSQSQILPLQSPWRKMDANNMFQAYTSTHQENSQTLLRLSELQIPLGSCPLNQLGSYTWPWSNQLWQKAGSHYPVMFAQNENLRKEGGGTVPWKQRTGRLIHKASAMYANFQKIIVNLWLR